MGVQLGMRSMFIKGGKRVPEPLNTISSVIPAAPTQNNFLFVISDLLFANHVRDLLKVGVTQVQHSLFENTGPLKYLDSLWGHYLHTGGL